MSSIEIVWTVLPHRVDGEQLRLSVFVSPRIRLDHDGDLGASGLGSWPRRVADMKFALELDDGSRTDVKLEAPEWRLDSELWEALFPPHLPVRAWEFRDHSKRPLVSFPAVVLHDDIVKLYGDLAMTGGDGFPQLDDDRFGPLLAAGRIQNAIDRSRAKRWEKAVPHPEDDEAWSRRSDTWPRHAIEEKPEKDMAATLGSQLDDPKMDQRGLKGAIRNALAAAGQPTDAATIRMALGLPLARRFYERETPSERIRSQYRARSPENLGAPPPELPAPEFHERLGQLGDHPALLRALGLVLDFKVAATEIPVTDDTRAIRTLRIRVSGNGADPLTMQCRRTRFDRSALTFQPACDPKLGGVRDGFLLLGNGQFGVLTADVDGSALKLADWSRSQAPRQEAAQLASASSPTESVPSLRSAPVTVGMRGRAEDMAVQLDRSTWIADAGRDEALTAQDIRRGYRIDVQYNGLWRSLCRRRLACYDKTVEYPRHPDDLEGYVKASGGTSKAKSSLSDPLYLHEALFSWDGWSLVAERPGEPLADLMDRQRRVAPEGTPTLLATRSEVEPGSLTRLRYGRSYRFRARVVDLAGNSLPPEVSCEEAATTPEFTYRRWEPVAEPVVVHGNPVTEGESLEHLVIRSDGDNGTATAFASSEHAEGRPYGPTCKRYLLPPKVTQAMAETHGMFDDLDMKQAFEQSIREQGTLPDLEGTSVWSPKGESDRQVPKRGDSLPEGHYVVLSEEFDRVNPETGEILKVRRAPGEMETPWLPDPMSSGVVLALDAPGGEDRRKRTWNGSWPWKAALRIDLADSAEGEGEGWSDTIRVALSAGTMRTAQLCTLPDPSRLDQQMALYVQLNTDPARKAAFAGKNWLLTPSRSLTFVHAVLKPCWDPELVDRVDFARSRKPGATDCSFEGELRLHRPSTGHVDVHARWIDPVDREGSREPVQELNHGHLGQLAIPYDDNEVYYPIPPESMRQDFGDTRHHLVRFRAQATTRYREYFAPDLTRDPAAITRWGPETTQHVHSTARPARPVPLYVVPTVRWQDDPDPQDSSIEVRRVGGSLRVWLDRPWWSSGEDELLAVVLEPASPPQRLLRTMVLEGDSAAENPTPDRFTKAPSHLLTAIGQDPLWREDREPVTAGVETFTPEGSPHVSVVRNVPLAEDPSAVVDIVTYRPRFDGTVREGGPPEIDPVDDAPSGRWYVDIDIDPNAMHMPFVRLALARYQPWSIVESDGRSNVALSSVVRAEFAQVLPDRWVRVDLAPDGAVVTLAEDPLVLPINEIMREPQVVERGRGWPLLAGAGKLKEAIAEELVVDSPASGIAGFLGKRVKEAARTGAENIAARFERPEPSAAPKVSDLLERQSAGTEILAEDRSKPVQRRISVELQLRARGEQSDLAWSLAPGVPVQPLAPRSQHITGAPLWLGSLRWTTQTRAFERRLVVREYEIYRSDGSETAAPAERMVFVAIIALR